jgi:hypothetical protein
VKKLFFVNFSDLPASPFAAHLDPPDTTLIKSTRPATCAVCRQVVTASIVLPDDRAVCEFCGGRERAGAAVSDETNKKYADTASEAFAACDRLFSGSGLGLIEIHAAMAHVETLNSALTKLCLAGVKREKIANFVAAWSLSMDKWDQENKQ